MARVKADTEEKVIELLRSRTMVGEVFDELFYMRGNPNHAVYPLWLLNKFDRLMGGIPPAFMVLVAKQKFGKSFFMQHLLRQTEKAGKRNVVISLEMDEFMLGCRIIASEAGVPLSKFSRPASMTDEEWNCVIEARAKIEEFNSIWNYDARTIRDIEQIVQALNPDYVFLDYVGLIRAGGRQRNRNEELGEIATMLKIISKAKSEGDEKQARFELLMSLVEQHTWLIGQEAVDKLKVSFGTRWDAYRQELTAGTDHQPRLRRGIFTPSQTSKEQQRKGELDETAPKDSQALFEACDLGLVGNVIEAPGGYAPNMRKIKIAVSRICEGGDEITIGINPSLGLVWDYDTYGANAPKTNIGARF